jgi:hypothetical protein
MAVLTFPGPNGEAAVGRALISIGQFVEEYSLVCANAPTLRRSL